MQGLSSYVRGSFATAALLRGVGVGTEAASPLSATAAFLARDLTGHAGGVLFALAQGGKLDAAAKQWRFAADCLNDVGYLITLLSPTLPRQLFLPAVCAASLAHALTGVAGGATRAALTAHFARQHNAADVAAKEGTQETCVTLIGMCVGYLCVRATAASAAAQWCMFALLTVLHVYANARAMRALRLTSLNAERLALLAWHHAACGDVLTVAQAAARESLLPRPRWLRHAAMPAVRLGTPLSELRRARGALPPSPARGTSFVAARGDDGSAAVCVALRTGATAEDVAAAFVHVVRAAALCARDGKGMPSALDAALAAPAGDWSAFKAALCVQGWDTSRIHVGADEGWRVTWE